MRFCHFSDSLVNKVIPILICHESLALTQTRVSLIMIPSSKYFFETSQVQLAGVSGGFPGVLPFRPPIDWLVSMSEIILKGTLN